MGKKRSEPWKPTGYVSETCETWIDGTQVPCGLPATLAYPAMGGGYHSMCEFHARRHHDISVTISAAKRGDVPRIMSAAPPTFATLRDRRRRLGVSLEDAARAAGLSVSSLRQYESTARRGSAWRQQKLAAFLDAREQR